METTTAPATKQELVDLESTNQRFRVRSKTAQDDLSAGHLASSVKHGYMRTIQQLGAMPELLKRQIDRLETAIDLSTDWLEIQYLMVELDQLKALYDDTASEAA
uniref:hypothetical protein n=1 Tax=Synechococcus sp. UW106 TaxID=368495 RepID=UPI0010BD88C9|nr:hypothetical protein [Synechococcus sp. UW106]